MIFDGFFRESNKGANIDMSRQRGLRCRGGQSETDENGKRRYVQASSRSAGNCCAGHRGRRVSPGAALVFACSRR